jgi:hypothetical protein
MVVYQNGRTNARKKLLFFQKIFNPFKRPFTAVKAAYTTKKAPFISIKPSHRESSTQHPASLFDFLFVILLFEV